MTEDQKKYPQRQGGASTPAVEPAEPAEQPEQPIQPEQPADDRPAEPRNSSSACTIIIESDLIGLAQPKLKSENGRLVITIEEVGLHIRDKRETTGDDPENPDTTTLTLDLRP